MGGDHRGPSVNLGVGGGMHRGSRKVLKTLPTRRPKRDGGRGYEVCYNARKGGILFSEEKVGRDGGEQQQQKTIYFPREKKKTDVSLMKRFCARVVESPNIKGRDVLTQGLGLALQKSKGVVYGEKSHRRRLTVKTWIS